MVMDNIGCLNSSFACVRTLTADFPPSRPYEQYGFSWTTLLPSEFRYFMDDPQQDHFLIFKQKCIRFVLYMFYFA